MTTISGLLSDMLATADRTPAGTLATTLATRPDGAATGRDEARATPLPPHVAANVARITGGTPVARPAGTFEAPRTATGNLVRLESAVGPRFTTAAEAMKHWGAGFTVEKRAYTLPGGEASKFRVGVVRTDTGAEIGSVSPDYGLVQNLDVFRAFDTMLADGGGAYTGAGVFDGGARVWVKAALTHRAEVVKGDVVETCVILRNAHDGSGAWTGRVILIRLACDNGMTVPGDERALFSFRHSKHVARRAPDAQNLVTRCVASAIAQVDAYKQLAAKRAVTDDVMAYLKTLIPDPAEEEAKKARANRERIRDEILTEMNNVLRGAAIPGVAGTWWAAYNGFSGWVDHIRHGRADTDRRTEENWFGSGAEMKADALTHALAFAARS